MSVQALYLARKAQYWNSSELHNANLIYLKHQNVSFYDTLCLKLQTTVSSDLRAWWAQGSFGIFLEIICRGMIYYMFKSIHDLLMTRRSGVCCKCCLDQPASQSRNQMLTVLLPSLFSSLTCQNKGLIKRHSSVYNFITYAFMLIS